MSDKAPFEQKISPAEHLEQIKKETAASPENAEEIIKEHLQKNPEEVYAEGYRLSPLELSELQKSIADPGTAEKEKAISQLLQVAEEKGILNAIKVAQKLPPSILDEFHDTLITYFKLSQ